LGAAAGSAEGVILRALLQRVSEAAVTVDGERVGSIRHGLLVLLGIAEDDERSDLDYLVKKIPALRIFSDQDGKMNLSVTEVGGSVLVISQFTLFADNSKGHRPSFFRAAKHEKASLMYDQLKGQLRANGLKVESGKFGADMKVSLVNDGPVTILLDSRENH
jgi:D-aminoacyl-tRNA deacylase